MLFQCCVCVFFIFARLVMPLRIHSFIHKHIDSASRSSFHYVVMVCSAPFFFSSSSHPLSFFYSQTARRGKIFVSQVNLIHLDVGKPHKKKSGGNTERHRVADLFSIYVRFIFFLFTCSPLCHFSAMDSRLRQNVLMMHEIHTWRVNINATG